MGLLDLFKTDPRAKIKGDIRYYNLIDWWLEVLSENERKRIIEVYHPMGSNETVIEGDISYSSGNPLSFLWCLSGWFKKKEDRKIAFKILEKAKIYIDSSPILDVHFYYAQMIDIYYPEREDPESFKKAIDSCLEQIRIAPEAAKAFKKEYPHQDLPTHTGYERLAIVYEKQKEYDEAIKISQQALEQGWCGDWEVRIERCERKSDAEKEDK